MINYADNAPPETITINGGVYQINTDYRVWIKVSDLFAELDFDADDRETLEHNVMIVMDVFRLVFSGKIPDEPLPDVLKAMVEFMQGYPRADNGYTPTEESDGTKFYSFKHDINYIVIAIRNQSGIDLSYKCEHFHWWLFLLEFQSLEDRHYISKIMARRAYKGDDKEMLKLKAMCALPVEYTRSEQRIIDELDELFYNT